jgi:hypothetical protein
MQNEMVSVVVPAYNAERWIARTLRSAQTQTYRNLEVIVVDDGSTDNTASLVGAAAAGDPRIRFVQQVNGGHSSARNAGIRLARGPFVAPLDADDLWHPQKIELQMIEMENTGSRVGVVYTWCSTIDEDDRVLRRSATSSTFSGRVYETLIAASFIACGSIMLLRRSLLEEVGGYNEALKAAEDLELCLRLAERCEFRAVPLYLTGYRITPGGASSDYVRMIDTLDSLLTHCAERHPDLPRKIFRWGKANARYHFALMSIRRGLIGDGFSMLLKALVEDPAIALRLVRASARKLLPRASSGGLHGHPFDSLDADQMDPSEEGKALWEHRRARLVHDLANKGTWRLGNIG